MYIGTTSDTGAPRGAAGKSPAQHRTQAALKRRAGSQPRGECRLAFVAALGLLSFAGAHADIADEVNAIRLKGCGGQAGLATPLTPNRALDEVTKQWSRGGHLRDAIQRSDYRAVKSSSAHIGGTQDRAKIATVLAEQYCDIILDPALSEIGVHTRRDQIWFVLAKPLQPPAPGQSAQVSERALQLVNKVRAEGRRCGKVQYPPAPPLRLAPLLETAARNHAQDMARHSRLTHEGSDGSKPADRVARAGYRWRATGENISAGFADIDAVVQGWIDSPGHCANIMGPQFKEMGIAYVVEPKSTAHLYWAQVFATHR